MDTQTDHIVKMTMMQSVLCGLSKMLKQTGAILIREVVKNENEKFTVRLTVRGGGGELSRVE